MYLYIERDTERGLKRTTYGFRVAESLCGRKLSVRYDTYTVETRPSRRHRNWNVEQRWGHHFNRSNNLQEKPYLPLDVREQVHQMVTERIEYEY